MMVDVVRPSAGEIYVSPMGRSIYIVLVNDVDEIEFPGDYMVWFVDEKEKDNPNALDLADDWLKEEWENFFKHYKLEKKAP